MKRILLLLLASTILIINSGCSNPFDDRIVYAGFAKEGAELHGAVTIATNKRIPVTIIGDTTTYTTMDLGGYVAIKRADLKELIRLANEKNH